MTTFDYIGGHNCKVHGHENSISSKDDLYHTFHVCFVIILMMNIINMVHI